MSELVVKAKIKELAKIDEKSLNVSTDFYDVINKKVTRIIEESCKRAKLNGRNTVMGKDVWLMKNYISDKDLIFIWNSKIMKS